jgi:hypothetical protein
VSSGRWIYTHARTLKDKSTGRVIPIYELPAGTRKKKRRRREWSGGELLQQEHRPWLTYTRPAEHVQLVVCNRKIENEKTGNEEYPERHLPLAGAAFRFADGSKAEPGQPWCSWASPLAPWCAWPRRDGRGRPPWPGVKAATAGAELEPWARAWERPARHVEVNATPRTKPRATPQALRVTMPESTPWLWTPAPPGHAWSNCGRWAAGRWWDHCSGYAPWSWDEDDDPDIAIACTAKQIQDATDAEEHKAYCECLKCYERRGGKMDSAWRSQRLEDRAADAERAWLHGGIPCEARDRVVAERGEQSCIIGDVDTFRYGKEKWKREAYALRYERRRPKQLDPIPAEQRRGFYDSIPLRPSEEVEFHDGTTIVRCKDPAPSRDNEPKRWGARKGEHKHPHMPDALVSEATTRGSWGDHDDQDDSTNWTPPPIWTDIANETQHVLNHTGGRSAKIYDPGWSEMMHELGRIRLKWRKGMVGRAVPDLEMLLADYDATDQWAPRLVHAILHEVVQPEPPDLDHDLEPHEKLTHWAGMTPSELAGVAVPAYVSAAVVVEQRERHHRVARTRSTPARVPIYIFRTVTPGRRGGHGRRNPHAMSELLLSEVQLRAEVARHDRDLVFPRETPEPAARSWTMCAHGYPLALGLHGRPLSRSNCIGCGGVLVRRLRNRRFPSQPVAVELDANRRWFAGGRSAILPDWRGAPSGRLPWRKRRFEERVDLPALVPVRLFGAALVDKRELEALRGLDRLCAWARPPKQRRRHRRRRKPGPVSPAEFDWLARRYFDGAELAAVLDAGEFADHVGRDKWTRGKPGLRIRCPGFLLFKRGVEDCSGDGASSSPPIRIGREGLVSDSLFDQPG